MQRLASFGADVAHTAFSELYMLKRLGQGDEEILSFVILPSLKEFVRISRQGRARESREILGEFPILGNGWATSATIDGRDRSVAIFEPSIPDRM